MPFWKPPGRYPARENLGPVVGGGGFEKGHRGKGSKAAALGSARPPSRGPDCNPRLAALPGSRFGVSFMKAAAHDCGGYQSPGLRASGKIHPGTTPPTADSGTGRGRGSWAIPGHASMNSWPSSRIPKSTRPPPLWNRPWSRWRPAGISQPGPASGIRGILAGVAPRLQVGRVAGPRFMTPVSRPCAKATASGNYGPPTGISAASPP